MTAAPKRYERASRPGLVVALVATISLIFSPVVAADPAAASPPPVAVQPAIASAPAPPPAAPASPSQAEAAAAGIVPAADLSKFQPGNIISDAAFFNSGTMTEAQIQAFLQAKVPTCQSGYTCLKDWHDTSRTTTADAMCGAYSGGVRERASRIIYKVAQACGINPQVILTMLQKEQGLVTHVWPSDWRYTIAMGQGCPDTAACDTRYYGFFNQVYGAAWQLKRYANPPGTSQYFTWYAPGKTWNVRYHPDASCGSAPVLIQNQATANLYYYTPYQPNAQALAAGYGDARHPCSAYGNRNFYNYFNDWFGSAQTVPSLVQHGDPVYLLSGTSRYHVTRETIDEFRKAYGAPVRVSAEYIALFADRGTASLFLRDASTGHVSLLQDGTRHHFLTCAQVALWGSGCGQETSLTSSVYHKVKEGKAVSDFATVTGKPGIYHLSGSTISPVYDQSTLLALNGGSAPFVGKLIDAAAVRLTAGPTRFVPGQFLTVQGSPRVYLPTSDGRLIYLAYWAHAPELGLPSSSSRIVPAASIEGYKTGETLTMWVGCGSTLFYAAGGTLYPVHGAAGSGFTAVALDAASCAALKRSTASALSAVYVQPHGQNPVYLAQDGKYRHVTSSAALNALGGGKRPTVLRHSTAAMATLPIGAPLTHVLPSGAFVRSSSSPRVYLPTSDGRLLYLPSWNLAAEFGLPTMSSTVVADALLALYRQDGDLGPWIACGSTTYFASRGVLYPVAPAAAKGFIVVSLDSGSCAVLNRSANTGVGTVFVQGIGQNEVYVAENGVYRHVTTQTILAQLGGGTRPLVFRLSADLVGALPKGAPITQ